MTIADFQLGTCIEFPIWASLICQVWLFITSTGSKGTTGGLKYIWAIVDIPENSQFLLDTERGTTTGKLVFQAELGVEYQFRLTVIDQNTSASDSEDFTLSIPKSLLIIF